MSSLLNDAIVDAKALREAALKNAEALVVDKYSTEVRETLEKLLEQEEEAPLDLGMDPAAAGAPPPAEDPMAALGGDMDMGGLGAMPPMEGGFVSTEEVVADVPFAATDNLAEQEGDNLNQFPASGEEVEVTVNLDALQEAIEQLKGEEEIELNEEDLYEILEADTSSQTWKVQADPDEDTSAQKLEADSQAMARAGLEEDVEDEELDISEEMIDEIVEKLTVDMGATLGGWAGRSSESQKYEMKRAMAQRRSTDVEEELETLKKAYEELVFENKQLHGSLEQYKQATKELREGMHDVNLSNARLLYTNRVLRNTSLNERQKSKIADAISKAGSVTEAKTIYHTLENATPTATKRSPQSLSEAIGRRSTSVIRASRQESTPSDPLAERMKQLAGIK
jgi:hypothetical protein